MIRLLFSIALETTQLPRREAQALTWLSLLVTSKQLSHFPLILEWDAVTYIHMADPKVLEASIDGLLVIPTSRFYNFLLETSIWCGKLSKCECIKDKSLWTCGLLFPWCVFHWRFPRAVTWLIIFTLYSIINFRNCILDIQLAQKSSSKLVHRT